MRLITDSLDEKGHFDARYTCDVDNSSPELRWEDAPKETESFCLIVEDPDAKSGLYTHWIIYRIPKEVTHLPAGIPPQDTFPNGIKQGINSAGKLGYAGPCPPRMDHAHRYFFRLFALRSHPEVSPRPNREELLAVINDLIIAEAQLVGLYQRSFARAG